MNEPMNTFQQFIIPYIRKMAIIATYIMIMLAALYLPLIFNCFSSQETLNICTFTETFSQEAIELFTQETGIKINLTYVELDEQILAKFKINDGEGYDVINISDFMVERLGSQGLLQQIDYDHIKNFSSINDRLLHHTYDPKNLLSVPHKWFMYGIVYDKEFFNTNPDDMSLDFIFKDPKDLIAEGRVKNPYKICMIDSPLDAFFLASRYLFGRHDNLSDDEYRQIRELLVAQKKWVESYTLYSIEYFLFTDLVPIALTASNFVRKIWDESDRFDFAVPKEGGILVIENLAIPKQSKNIALAHKFIDFMISDKIATLNGQEYGWAPANKKANAVVDKRYTKESHLFPNDYIFKRLYIPLYSRTSRVKIEDIWLSVGFA